MLTDEQYNVIVEENGRRRSRLAAEYDPITGKGLDALLGERRVLLSIPDFAIPEQWVPEAVVKNPLIKAIVKSGSIDSYIAAHKWKTAVPAHIDIERRIRRIRHKHDFCFWAYFCIKDRKSVV